MTFVSIDGCWFEMGSNDGEDNERPVHRVWVDAFAIATHAITNAEYAAFEALPFAHDARFNDPEQPVIGVSWHDAVRYCEWRGDVRLPTEAEWELAARGGVSAKRYPWGDDVPADATHPLSAPHRVAQGRPNGFGLYDMCENVHEWCADWYAGDFYALSPARNPRGPDAGIRRVSRGGSWRHRVTVTRCAARSSLPPDSRYTDYGFRVVETMRSSS